MLRKIAYRVYVLISATLIMTLGVVIAEVMYTGANKLPLRQYFARAYTNAVWDWSDPIAKTPKDLSDISDFMYLHQINAVYVNVGDAYLSILAQPTSERRTAAKQRFEEALTNYITKLGQHHIAVYAAAGDVNWSNQDKQYIPLEIMRQVENYNQHHSDAQLAGVEFDVEAYNQAGFNGGSMTVKSLALTDWLDMVDKLAVEDASYAKSNPHGLELGFAIPYWFDNENGNIPAVTWNNKTGPTLYHLLDRLDPLPKSNIVVMDYRNVAQGNDGIIFHGRTEIEYAQAKAPNVRVLIGQEVNDVQPAKITYFGQSMTELASQVAIVEDAFHQDTVLSGIAINDLGGLQRLADTD